MSSADLTALRYVKEVTFGVTPATPALRPFRYTGESLNFAIENTKSAEITPTRVETDLVQTSASAAGDVNIELSFGSYTDLLEGLFCNSFGAPVSGVSELENGTIRHSFSIQKHFQDMAVPQFHTFNGCVVESLSLTMEIGKIVEGAFSFLALGNTVATAQIAGATFPAPTTTTPMNAVANVKNFTIGGVPYSGCISSLKLLVKNNARAIMCIGSLQARNMKLGTMEVTGDMEFYFEEGSTYELFVEGTEFDISFDLEDGAGNLYTFEIPRAKFESGDVTAGGKNSDVMFKSKWRGLYDGTSERVIRLLSEPAV
jgi:hypothetical protein